jgi:hypothetical protein
MNNPLQEQQIVLLKKMFGQPQPVRVVKDFGDYVIVCSVTWLSEEYMMKKGFTVTRNRLITNEQTKEI